VKRELRDDDAVASEEAGHAYIGTLGNDVPVLMYQLSFHRFLTESFALKVFNLADVEDQGGNATR
jgi:hypothetical protein